MHVPYRQECRCIRVLGAFLRLPHQVVATALAFLHDVHARDVHKYIDDGQAGLRTNDLVNAVALAWPLSDGDQWCLPSAAALQQAVQAFTPIVAEAYSSAKQVLLRDEQVVLRLLRFQLCVEHPHTHLLNLCDAVNASPRLATLATCLVNDGLTYTSGSVTQPPLTRACAALLVAMEMLGHRGHERWVRQVAAAAGRHDNGGRGGEEGLRVAMDTYSALVQRAESTS